MDTASTGSKERLALNLQVEPEPQEIRRALALLHEPGEVFEIRALNGKLKSTLSGYFDDHTAAAAAAVDCVRRGAEVVCVTLNPVNPVLLNRGKNKLGTARTSATTSDRDITRRQWLFIDVDARLQSGISSTDDEHDAAMGKAREIAAWLESCNFPSPVLADSGNGAHLLYRIDLPTSDNQLISRVLTALNKLFGDEYVKVDTSVSNPARIIKTYGTPARKGDSTHERPHRPSRLLEVPADLEHVPKGRLEDIAALPKAESMPQSRRSQGTGFDVRQWLSRFGLEVLREESYGDGIRITLRNCPFGEHRKPEKSAVFINANGSLGFKCFSNDHAGLGWKELRERYEPRAASANMRNIPQNLTPPTRAATGRAPARLEAA